MSDGGQQWFYEGNVSVLCWWLSHLGHCRRRHTLARMHARSVCQALHVLFCSLFVFLSLMLSIQVKFQITYFIMEQYSSQIEINYEKISSEMLQSLHKKTKQCQSQNKHKMHFFHGVCHDISYHFSFQAIFNAIFYVSFHYKWIIVCLIYLHALLTWFLFY